MKILVDGGSSGSGGYLQHLRGVLGARVPADIAVTLLASPRQVERLGLLGADIGVVRPPELDDPRATVRHRWWLTRFPQVVRDVGPDVILHAHGLVRGRAPGVPRAVIHHSPTPFLAETYRLYGLSAESARYLLTRQRVVSGLRRADGVVFQHDFWRDEITRQVRGIRATTVVGHATPVAYGDLPRLARAELPATPRILCVTRQFLFRYQWVLVHAVCDLRVETGLDLRLDLVGGGDARTARRVADAIRERRAEPFVTRHGDVPPARMLTIYADADVFVFPSAQETSGITLFEAMANGLPIACSDRMPMPDILRDAGVYFDPADRAAMTDALRTLLADGGLRVRLGGLAQVYAHRRRWQDSADSLWDFLRRLTPPWAAVPAPRGPLGALPVLGRRR
jgi:glycosyltransferase involved in cell wall biosynthesis